MSQEGIIDILGTFPQIPTSFIANSGSAVPILNQVDLLGSVVAAGTNPFRSVASGNTLTFQIQMSQAIAATDATKVGLSAFNSAEFSVDANGFVTLTAGGLGVLSVSGTANRITSTGGANPVIDISALYVGQTSITTLGTVTTGVWHGSTIDEAHGGTNQTTYTTGDILYASAANTLSKLAVGSNTNVLTLTAGIPSWAAPASSGTVTSVSGTANQVAVATGTTTPVISLIGPYTPATYLAHGVLIGEGTSSIAVTAVGATGQVLTGVTGSDPVWASPATSGTVTSVSGTANQVSVATGTTTPVISLVGPYTPATYLAHGVIIGEGTSSLVATAVGTTGQVLTGVTGADPVWASPATSGTVTSVSGTANQVAVATGTTTPVISLVGPYTPATYLAHGVLIGEGTSSIVATAVGTTGQVLTGVTGADPVWASPTTSGTVTSVSGTANQVSVATGTTTPVISLVGPYTPATYTAHGVLIGEGTSSIAATTVGTTGQILTGVTGADPVWAAPAAPAPATGSVVQYDVLVGGATNTIVSVGPGTAGQIFQSAGNAASPAYSTSTYPTTNAINTILYASAANVMSALATANSGVLATSSTGVPSINTSIAISSGGAVTMPLQPCFHAYRNAAVTNVTGDGTTYAVVYDTVLFDQGSNFNITTGVFTAPKTGKYLFTCSPSINGLGAANTICIVQLVTTLNSFQLNYSSASTTVGAAAANGIYNPLGSIIVPMTATNTAFINITVYNGTKIVGLNTGIGGPVFTGYLVA